MYNKYSKEPKRIITGVGVELEPGYFEVICNSILPETDKEYIRQHKEIEANMKLIAAAPKMFEALSGLISRGEIMSDVTELKLLLNSIL